MVKDGLNRTRKKLRWSILLAAAVASGAWVETGKAQPAGTAPGLQAPTGAKASAPVAKKAPTPVAKAKAPKKVGTKRPAAKPGGGGPPVPKARAEREPVGPRDPFKLPGPPVPGREGLPEQVIGPLPPGTRGLVISQVKLEGIVRLDTTNTMLAVVDNNTNRAYFLRENDPVYNGVVSKITPDSVTFKENYLDPSGQMGVRDVVKRLGSGPGEGR